ncbi:WD40 repeat-like protein, partial [Gyrodon lividus]
LPGHMDWVWSVAFLPDGEQVIGGSVDGSVQSWRIRDGREVGTVMEMEMIGGHSDWVWSLALAPDSARFVSGSEDR